MMEFSRSLWVIVAAAAFFSCGSVTVVAQQVPPSCKMIFAMQNGTQKTFTQCQSLAVQGATLAWNYFPGQNASNGTVTGGILDLAYTNTLLSAAGWVGWGINPSQLDMVGSSVLVAFTDSSAGSVVLPFKLNEDLKGSNPLPLVSGATDLVLLDKSVDIDAGTLITTIYATLRLKAGVTTVNQVWNKGPSVSGRSPNQHDISSNSFLTSLGTLDVTTGTAVTGGAGSPALQNVHGIVNAISWGILFPVGIMAARYMRPFALFDPIWFYVHVGCQVCGYILGVAGWAIGMKILNPANVKYKHRDIGITLFVLATVQIAALVLRPNPDHKLRKYWDVYHHAFGYTIMILSIVNIFEGFHLLLPAEGWKHAYIGVIIALGAIALILEIVTWVVWLKRRSRIPAEGLEGGLKLGNGHVASGSHGNNGNNKREAQGP